MPCDVASASTRGPRALPPRDVVLLALLYLSLAAPYALAHVDEVDSVTYRVITRHLLQDGTLFELRFLSTWFPRFLEHPPFMFWVWAATSRLAGEGVLPWIGVGCGLSTVLATYAGGAPLVGRRAAFLGSVFLVVTESFFRAQGSTTLDPPLTLAFTASTMLLLSARGRWRLLAAGSLASGLGALVKGPPAWGALAAAWLGLLVMGRRREVSPGRWLLVAAGALAPFAVFLAYDRLALGGAWWDGYVLGQVAASAMGATRDGHTERLYLVREVLGRFPHGLPFVVVALLGALGRQRRAELRARLALLGWAGVVVGGYSAAARAWPWYLLPAYPALGLVAGAGLDDLLSRVRGGLGFRWAQRVVGVAALALLGALPACTPLTGRLPLGIAPCEFGDLPGRARELARERMALLAANVWASSKNQVFVLAEHTGLDVVGLSDAEALARRDDLWVALVRQDITPVPAGWTVVATYGRWALASRARRPRDPAPLPE